MKKLILISIVLLAAAITTTAQQNDFPKLTGPYLGQKPPGRTPEIFAPGIVSSAEFIDFKGAFSPDGQEYYFYRHALPEILPALFFTRIENGVWAKPAPLPIAQGARTSHPCVSLDNQWLFFYWQFPPEQNRPTGFYASARTDAGWSAPKYAGQGMYLTSDHSGRFYTTESVWGSQPKHYLARVTFRDGLFTQSERLTIHPHYENQTHPCIAPDGSYIIFDINVENGSLFLSFKDENGQWGEGIDLTKHGFKPDTRGAYISPDGKYLFFSVDGDIWWVDIQVIEKLRPEQRVRADHENTIESSRSQLFLSAAEIIDEILTEKGVEGIEPAKNKLRELKKQPEKYLISEKEFNSLGYRFLRQNKLPQAMTVFRMNAETFPRSANVYDSLAEACLYWGDKYNTIRNYKKSLELNPQNENARSRLERMDDLFEEHHPTTPDDALFAAGKQMGLKGPYLGQRPPGLKKEVFAPGIVSTKGGHEFSCTFSPDGREFYFNRGMTIMVCRWEQEGWTAPQPASFNGDFRNHEPHITADNRTLYFGSMRPNPDRPEMEDPYGLWKVERTERGWGEPGYVGYGMYVTTTTNGTAYLTDQDDEDFSKHGIARTKLVNGRFGPFERQKGGVLSPAPGRMSGRHPCVAPDESFLIFDSYTIDPPGGAAQLFISFRENDGSWGKATNLSEILESERNIAASLSPDGQYLFFRAESDIYWVSTKIFDHLKRK